MCPWRRCPMADARTASPSVTPGFICGSVSLVAVRGVVTRPRTSMHANTPRPLDTVSFAQRSQASTGPTAIRTMPSPARTDWDQSQLRCPTFPQRERDPDRGPSRQPIRPGQGSVSLTDFGSQAFLCLLVVGDPTAINGRYWPFVQRRADRRHCQRNSRPIACRHQPVLPWERTPSALRALPKETCEPQSAVELPEQIRHHEIWCIAVALCVGSEALSAALAYAVARRADIHRDCTHMMR